MCRSGPRSPTFCLIALLILPLTGPGWVDAHPSYGVVWYTHSPANRIVRLGADRFDLGITDGEPGGQEAVKARDPGFQWFLYDSITDIRVLPQSGAEEYQALLSLAGGKGWDPEEAYLHYAEDTRLVLGGDTLLVRGWPRGTARSAAESRVPVQDRTRCLVHFATPRARQLHKELVVHRALDFPFAGTRLYPDGIFLDNASAKLSRFGTILSGGAVSEAAGLRIQTPAFQDWQWKENLGPFLAALKDTLETSAGWARDHRPKRLMVNVTDVWDDSYVFLDVAHVLFLESQYNPIRNAGQGAVDEAYRRDRTAADAGITLFYAASTATSVPGRGGELSYDRVLLGNLAWYFVTRTERSIFFELGSSTPGTAGWDTLTWRGCLETAANQLGDPQGPPFTLAEGTDPAGNRYVVKARRYRNGLAAVRNRGEGNQDLGPETRAVIPLRDPMAPILPSGTIGTVVSSVALRNGEGVLLLGGR